MCVCVCYGGGERERNCNNIQEIEKMRSSVQRSQT